MAGLDNLSRGELAGILKRLRALEIAAPLQNASIGANGLRVYDGGMITIENGGLYVSGSATIIGTLNAEGTINMSGMFIASGEMRLNGNTIATGDFKISGPLLVDGNTTFNGKLDINGATTVTGNLAVKGPLDVTGTMDIKGKSTLQNDLDVKAGGKINVGSNMTLTPTANGGSVEFANRTSISGRATDLVMDGRGSGLMLGLQALLTAGNATLIFGDTGALFETQLVRFSSRVMTPALRVAPSGAKPNLYCDPATGEIMQIP